MNKPTPGPWRVKNKGVFVAMPIGQSGSHLVAHCLRAADAPVIVAAVNACFSVNPLNPLAVAEALPELVEATQSVMIKLCDLMNPGLDRPRPDLEEMHDGLAAALAKIGAKGK